MGVTEAVTLSWGGFYVSQSLGPLSRSRELGGLL